MSHQSELQYLMTSPWMEIADLPSHEARSEFIDHHAELLHLHVVSDLAARVPQLAKSDRQKALSVAEAAVLIADRLDSAEAVAQSLRAKGNALYALGQTKSALEHQGKALRLFRSLDDAEQVARTLSSSIQPLILQGHYGRARAAAREARAIFLKLGNRWRVARLDLNVGNIFDRQDHFAEALKCYERAYRYLCRHQQEDPEAVGVALHNMAVAQVSLNHFREAETIYGQAREFALAHDMAVLVGQADYNIAWLYYLRGNYNRAISLLRTTRETCRCSGDEYHFALCHLDLSEIYLELNLRAEAAEAAEQAAASFSLLGMQYESAKSIANLAIATAQQGKADSALGQFTEAREIFAAETNKVLPYVIDLYRALVLYGERRDGEASSLCLAALEIFQRFKLTSKATLCRLLLARLHLRASEFQLAKLECARALRTLARLDMPVLSCQAHALQGRIHAAAGNQQRAYEAFLRARTYVERLRDGIHGEELKISFMKDRVGIYEDLISACMSRAKPAKLAEEIFGYVQQAKSRTLWDVLSTSHSTSWLAPQDETDLARRIRDLREELNWYFRKVEIAQLQQASQHNLAELREQSLRREKKLLRLLREHADTGSADGQLTATAFSVDQIRESLSQETAILEYFQVKDHLVVLVIGRDQLRIVPLGEASRVSTLLELLQLQLAKLRLNPDYVTAFASVLLATTHSHLRALHQLLIEPLRPYIYASHLVIAPHGMLHNLPFQALFDGKDYLIDEFTVSYAPSSSVLHLCHARSAETQDKSLILGIPDVTVPCVREEVQAVAACLPNSEVFLGETATADCLREKGRNSRFIHIATHGYFRRDNPMFSGIRLGDSYLSLYDLYQLRLPAELIALSGCSTGVNVVAPGDELLGLVRGLVQTGAETSLLTLWDVQDQSSAELMSLFYNCLAGGGTKAHALQRAMQRLKSERPHPYYWAAFILVGKN